MKKKGLIVATIVMVLVLAVSLTTATYAWFTADSQTTIDAIGFTVTTAADVIIGLKTDGEIAHTTDGGSTTIDPVTLDNFVTDGASDVLYTPTGQGYTGTWSGQAGLGSSINTGLNFNNITSAIGTGTPTVFNEGGTSVQTPGSVTANWDSNKTVVKANGTGFTASSVDTSSVYAAKKNAQTDPNGGSSLVDGDYLDIVIGVQATKAELASIVCNVTVNPTATNGATIGMNAAIHVRWSLNDVDWHDVDVYGNNRYGTAKGSITDTYTDLTGGATRQVATTESTNNAFGITGLNALQGACNIAIPVVQNESGISTSEIYQIHLIIFVAGYDSDCITAALNGTNSAITINFTTTAVQSGGAGA